VRAKCCASFWLGCSSPAGETLAGDTELRGEINQGFRRGAAKFHRPPDQKSGVSSVISDSGEGLERATDSLMKSTSARIGSIFVQRR